MTRRPAVAALAAAAAVPFLGFFDPPPPAGPRAPMDGAVVLSGDVDYVRIRRAAELFRTGAVRGLALTGRGLGGDDAEAMAREATRLGVPAGVLLIEHESTSTRENIERTLPLVRRAGWRRVAVVTSRSHLLRAVWVARRLAPDIEWEAIAVPDPGGPQRLYNERSQEWVKLAWYGLRGWL